MTTHSGGARWARVLAMVAALSLIGSLASCASTREGVAGELAKEARCADPVPDIYDRVSPAVVFIVATSIDPYQLAERVTRVVGSGVIIDPSGLILTNSHVAYGRQSIMVILDDGTSVQGKLVGADPIFDLAVLRIPPPSAATLPTVTLGDSDRLRVGEEVLAIGNPLGLEQTLTRGVVSAINRVLPETPFSLQEPLIQTDAAINPGNSGGPLLNRCGEVVGINTAVIAEAQNIGFSIPVNLAKSVLRSLLTDGRVIRPWVGFHGQLITGTLRKIVQMPVVDGLLIEVIEPGSPAERVGLRGGELELSIAGRSFLVGGDIITSVNGTRMNSPETLGEIMRGLKVGATLRATVFRNGEYLEVEYMLPERPVLPGDLRGQRSFGPFTGSGSSRPSSRDRLWRLR